MSTASSKDTGAVYFEAAAETQRETSSDAALASKKNIGPPRPGDGAIVTESRGKPKEK